MFNKRNIQEYAIKSIRSLVRFQHVQSTQIRRFLKWFYHDDQERIKRKAMQVWIQLAQNDLIRAYNLIADFSNKAWYESSAVSQGTINWAVHLINRYETVKRPQTPLNLSLAFRLGFFVPAIRLRIFWLMIGYAAAIVLVIVLHWLVDFPLHCGLNP